MYGPFEDSINIEFRSIWDWPEGVNSIRERVHVGIERQADRRICGWMDPWITLRTEKEGENGKQSSRKKRQGKDLQ